MTTATEKLYDLRAGPAGALLRHADGPGDRARAAANDNRFSSLILGIIESDAFQKRVK